MKTDVQEPSMDSYHSDKMRSSKLQKMLVSYASKRASFSSRMAAEYLGVSTATMSGIVKPMLKSGILARDLSKYPCEVSGNNVYWLRMGK